MNIPYELKNGGIAINTTPPTQPMQLAAGDMIVLDQAPSQALPPKP
ncbi:MAG: hypothetical protein KGJ84_12330 [Elusimicrobia bacterium]|nr:hypothetical protein [Elusimicrobiota bacterium]